MGRRSIGRIVGLFVIFVLGLSALFITIRRGDGPIQAIVVNSNIRDYDQALYLMTPRGQILRRLTTIPGGEYVIDQSADGKWLLVKSNVNNHTYSINVVNGMVRELADSAASLLTISPDSRWVYFRRIGYAVTGSPLPIVFRIALNGSDRQVVTPTSGNITFFNYVGLSPDGAWLYLSTQDLIRVHTDSHDVKVFPSAGLGTVSEINWSDDGKWMYILYYQNGENTLGRMAANGVGSQQTILNHIGLINQLFLSPGGE